MSFYNKRNLLLDDPAILDILVLLSMLLLEIANQQIAYDVGKWGNAMLAQLPFS